MSNREPHREAEGDNNLSSLRQAWARNHIDAETAGLLAEDERHFLRQSLSTPCLNALASCQGAGFTDLQGRQYLDFHGNSAHQVGYANPRVMQAVMDQMRTLPFCPRRYANDKAVALAGRLAGLAPGDLSKVLFAPGGTTAVGMALKLARVATGRHKTVSMWDAFHGASLDAISVGGESAFRAGIGPLLPGTEHVPPYGSRPCPFGCQPGDCNLTCARYVDYVLEKEGDVAAVIAETVRCTAVTPPPAEYWRIIRQACDRRGALLILDETAVCLGRTGKMFACEHYGIVPDILILGKGLGGGMLPLAAIIARAGLDLAPDKALGHYTHEKNPLACAAGLAVLDCLLEDGLLANSVELGDYALKRLTKLATASPILGEARGIGLLLGVEVIRRPQDMDWRYVPDPDAAEAIMYACLERGLSFKVSHGHILTLTPTLSITRAELDQALDILAEAVAVVRAEAIRTDSDPDITPSS